MLRPPPQFRCQNQARARKVDEDGLFNGIDYLEVLDDAFPEPVPGGLDLRQRVLLVHLFLPVPLAAADPNQSTIGPGNVIVSGGVRIANVVADWVAPARAVKTGAPPQVPAAERALIAPLLPDPATAGDLLDRTLVIRTSAAGDFSPYELSIAGTSTDGEGFNLVFPGFDGQLSRVTFTFKVDCPSDFDCAPDDACPPEVTQAPVIDYLARDFASFRTLMLDRMAQTTPAWRERNVADIGIALVEILAYAGDQMSYFQDAVANEAYLGTARRRPSLRRHARLLDYTPREGTNARTFVHMALAAGTNTLVLPRGTPILTGVGDDPPASIVAGSPQRVADAVTAGVAAGAQVFETMDAVTLHETHDEIGLYTWGDTDCCLPKGATRATLLNPSARPLVLDPAVAGALEPGALLSLEEVRGPEPDAPADPRHRHVVRLTAVRPDTDPVYGVDVVDVEWAVDDALPFPLCLREVGGQPVSVARGNVVLADHGQSVSETLPLPPTQPNAPRFLPRLSQGPITFRGRTTDSQSNLVLVDASRPAVTALRPDPRQAEPDIVLFPLGSSLSCGDPQLAGSPEVWRPVRDLLESGPFSQSFVVETENDGSASLRFGDGQQGERPLAELVACYRIGNGTSGNIGAGALATVIAPSPGISAVSNPLPAVGGEDPEPAEEIRLSAPQAFRVQERAVTEADYAEVARRHPGVQRVVATRRFTGSWYTMFIAVDRLGGLPVDAAFERELAAFFERFRLAGYDLEIQGAVPVPLEIKLTVCVRPGFFRFDVKQALLEAFSNRDQADGRRGLFHPDNFTFGQSVFLSRVIATALAVPGVGQVETGPGELVFKRLNQLDDPGVASGVLAMDRLEIAQLDNDPSQPEHGKIEFVMQGGS